MIAANYFSAWVGGLFVLGGIVPVLPMDLNNGWVWFWVMVVFTFFLTSVLEWPFIGWTLRGTKEGSNTAAEVSLREGAQPASCSKPDLPTRRPGLMTPVMKRSLRVSLKLQRVSYLLLFGWYFMASGTSLYTKMNIVGPDELSLPESVLVYYIDREDGDVYQRNLVRGGERKIFELHSNHHNDRLFVRPNPIDTNRWDLMARLESDDHRKPRFVEVRTNMPVVAAPDWRSISIHPQYDGTWFSFGQAARLGIATNSPWRFHAGFWPVEGLRGKDPVSGKEIRFAYETPFGAWTVRNAVLLPSDKVLFQLGNDQICGFSPVDRRVALLWRGRGPVPVIEKDARE